MIRLIRHIALTGLIAFALLLLADLAYTAVLSHVPASDKIGLLKTHRNQKINYVFVGSSRVNNSVIPSVIRTRTGKTALNLGISSARPHDVLTVVRLLKSHNISCDTIFVQTDYGFNHLDSSTSMEYYAMPYVWNDAVLRAHIGYLPDAFAIRYVPFYRYAAYDQKIGLRALYKGLRAERPGGLEKSAGYMMRKGQVLLDKYALPGHILESNPYQDTLNQLAKKEKLHLVYFTSPFMKSVKTGPFLSRLSAKTPGLHDYSKAIADDKLFSNQSHLNHEGAIVFTNLLVDDLLLRKGTKKAP